MKAPLVRVVIASTIFLVLLTQIFAAPTPPPDSTTLGVNLNDSFTFVVSKIVNPLDPDSIISMGPGKYSGDDIELQEGDTYTMTITNTTMGHDIDEGHFLEVTFANASKSIITEVPLTPGIGPLSFTNWTAWETLINTDPIGYFGTDYLNHTLSRDYAEFSLEYWEGMYWNATTTIYLQLHIVYDVLTGVSVLQEVATYNFDAIGFVDIEFVISRQGYIKPPPPSSTTTSTTTSGTISPSTSSTTSGTTSTATSTATSSASSTETTTTVTPTNSSVTTNSNTGTETISSTTSTSASRQLSTFTPSSTLDRNTTEETSETPESAIGDDETSSSDGVPEVPGFGAILGFTALITTITIIRYKKH